MTGKGYKPLHKRKESIAEGWGEMGIDAVFKKGDDYYIVEAKYGAAGLSTLPNGIKQMSDAWITSDNRIRNAVGGDADLANLVLNNYKRILAKVDEAGNIIYREINSNGSLGALVNM